jgi:haloalkane dehalogenase
MQDIQTFMGKTDMPVLLAYAEPGVLVPPQAVPFYTDLIDNLETAFVGQGLHFIQEDQPDAIGRAIADWLRRN